jgi:diguanylate cyclase (GGDEF)-like protein/PAS domain S-box-containing protein
MDVMEPDNLKVTQAASIVFGIFLCGLLLLGAQDILFQGIWTSNFLGFSFHPTSLLLFIIVSVLGAARRLDGMRKALGSPVERVSVGVTFILFALLGARSAQWFDIGDFILVDQILGNVYGSSYTPLGTLLGLTLVHIADAYEDRYADKPRSRIVTYAYHFCIFGYFLHQGIDLIFEDRKWYHLQGISILSCFLIAVLALLTLVRSNALDLLLDERLQRSNAVAIGGVFFVFMVFLGAGSFLHIEGSGFGLGLLAGFLLPLIVARYRRSELTQLIESGFLAPDGSAYDRETSETNKLFLEPEGSYFLRWLYWETFEATGWQRSLTQGVVTFLLAYGAIYLCRINSPIALLWWANAYLSYMLFIRAYGDWPRTIITFYLVVLMASLMAGDNFFVSAQFAGINSLEGIGVAAIVKVVFGLQVVDRQVQHGQITTLSIFILVPCLLLAYFIAACLGSGMITVIFGGQVSANIYNWFAGRVIGGAVMAVFGLGVIFEMHFSLKRLRSYLPHVAFTGTAYVVICYFFAENVSLTPFFLFPAGILLFILSLAIFPSLIQSGVLAFFAIYFFVYFAQARNFGGFESLSLAPGLLFTFLFGVSVVTLVQMFRFSVRQAIDHKIIFEDRPFSVLATTLEGRVLYASGQVKEMFGLTEASFKGRKLLEIVRLRTHDGNENDEENFVSSFIEGEQLYYFDANDGGSRVLCATTRSVTDASFSFSFVTTLEDKTELIKEQVFSANLIDKSTAIILTEDKDLRVMSCSEAWSTVTGYTREETVGRDFIDFITPQYRIKAQAVRESLLNGSFGESTYDTDILSKAGDIVSLQLNVRMDRSSVNAMVILTGNDITAAKKAGEELQRLVEIDELTGLYSRRGLNRVFEFDQRSEDLGMYLIDLDHFKSVNDGYGHDAGDKLLKAIAGVLQGQTGADGPCFRLGGEEFAVLRSWLGWKDAHDFAETLRESIGAASINSDGRIVQRTASISVSYLPMSGSLSEALKLGDMVLRDAKALGRDRSVLADETLLESLRSRGMFIQASEVQLGLERGEFKYLVQPIVDGPEKSTVGFEALVRWFLPSGGSLEPKKFVDLLYEVIRQPRYAQLKLDLRRQVLEQLKEYPEKYVSFNFTLEEIGYVGGAQALYRDLQSILDHPERKIVIELSESALNARVNEDVLIEELSRLRAYGYKIALDDFGVERSNIQRLQHYPIDIVKLDRSLIMDLETSEKARKMVGSLAVLLKSLELDVTVEGIETEEQAQILNDFGLTIHQGYLYRKPVHPNELE